MEWLTIPEAAALLRVSENGCRKLCMNGEIPAAKVGRKWLVSKDRLEDMLEERCTEKATAHA